ncbi:hypothetical protein DY000_02060592 [Brassica cretica]|uniref:Uncharacterized protein n=1 Tax=Brassica cretica TaxID=69181 RepID=A0ABQ7ATH5_BRACR|nr:hypothetical protein DY000_02060592 [Brassica cretica]
MSSSAASVANAAVAYSTFNSHRLERSARTVVRPLSLSSSAFGILETSTKMANLWG